METVKIVVLCIVSAILYGILHDQVTARVCVEYFTIGHPPIFNTNSPTLLALGWGTIATWWVGLLLSIPITIACRWGQSPEYTSTQLIRPIGKLLIVMGFASLLAGVIGYLSASLGWVWLVGPLASSVPEAKHAAFLADLWAHLAAYATGFMGGIVICRSIWISRHRQRPLAK